MRTLCFVFVCCAVAGLKTRIRVVQWNIHAWRDSEHADNYEEIAVALEALKPDVLLLNEVLHPFAADGKADEYFQKVKSGQGRGLEVAAAVSAEAESPYLDRLAHRLGLDHKRFGEAERDLCFFGKLPFGSALCSRYPIIQSGVVRMLSKEEDIKLGDQPRDSVESRGAVWASIAINDSCTFVFATAHLDHKSEQLRHKQMRTCLSALPPGIPKLIAGDFNTFQRSDHSDLQWDRILAFYKSRGWPEPAPTSLVLDLLRQQGWTDAAANIKHQKEVALEPTCWTHRPLFRIDHAWLSPEGLDPNQPISPEIRSYKRPNVTASDHFPVVIDLTL